MSKSWQKLDAWLRAHGPGAFASLKGPASAQEIAVTEATIGIAFPASLRESFLAHDGEVADSSGLFEYWQLLPLDRVKEHWDEFLQLEREYGNRHFGSGEFDAASAIPVMWSNGEIRYLRVTPDNAEAPLYELPRHGPPVRLADSWEAYLQEQVRRIDAGELVVEPDFGLNLVEAGTSASGA